MEPLSKPLFRGTTTFHVCNQYARVKDEGRRMEEMGHRIVPPGLHNLCPPSLPCHVHEQRRPGEGLKQQ